MASLETLKMKFLTGEYSFVSPPLTLKYDPRHGSEMPFAPLKGMLLEDARRAPCEPPRIERQARELAQSLFFNAYWWTCEHHGPTMFHTASGKCSICYKESKRKVTPARAAAKVAGEATYMDHCAIHLTVAHSTARGLCLSCYNTLGKPRPKSTNPRGWYINLEGIPRQCPE